MELNQWLKSFQLKDNRLVGPFFYGTPLALRFEIGPADEAEELSRAIYLERAYARAVELFEQASSEYDYVLLSLLRQEDRDIDTYLWHFSSKFNFDQDLNALLREIVKADHGGFNYLSSSVLFLSSQDNIIYHCYDDRGVDIAVLDDDKRLELFTDCHDLLFDYDMEEMERRMRG
ncbi:TPA: DUF3885 domain-containing protein [Streptococcus suis]|nr:DUF3885 domain-containing protein [Streptococcus suis]HEM3947163.1 DUF3885 domain-containing protein [Streptococcus suis]HEM3951862.1 DUF3885 domain-containing protein [Streptococcus suis]HEM3956885.1 DUF3885 domain-containing protein [Streptococcus suis]HEM3961890.1 DUF3885 domain-containing protein [Streptococcus suis]